MSGSQIKAPGFAGGYLLSLQHTDSPSTCSPAKFVELFPGPSPAVRKCVVEFEDGHGARVRVHLEDPDATLLGALGERLCARRAMIQLTPQMRILVAVEPVDFRRGIDGLARLCRETLGSIR